MAGKYEHFIGTYDGAVGRDFCKKLIDFFEWSQENNRTYSRPDPETRKKDDALNLNPGNPHELNLMWENCKGFIGEFNDAFWSRCYPEYTQKYSTLEGYDKHTILTYKLQKTEPTGGYHVWHCEDGAIQFSRRIGVYILYLNDVEEGGETEFLYLSKRIKPKAGTLLIFPPNYPWTHRGNPPLAGTKYVLTGWTEFS